MAYGPLSKEQNMSFRHQAPLATGVFPSYKLNKFPILEHLGV